MVRQFGKLGVQLEIRATDYNQFQDKVLWGSSRSSGGAGWLTTPTRRELPFLLYGPERQVSEPARTRPTTATLSTTGTAR